MKKKLLAILSCFIFALTLSAMTSLFFVSAAESLTEKDYVPNSADAMDYYGTVGNIDEADGGGITTFAHAGLLVPLSGENISLVTQFKLLSKKAVEEGGDGVDGWITYSFSKTPAGATDNTFPYFGGGGPGLFLHVTNYSGTTAPNCVEVLIVEHTGTETKDVTSFFLDNAVDTKINLKLEKTQDGKYDLSFVRLSDMAMLKKVEGLALTQDYFVNESGQTYFSTAIYEGPGCDGQHWEHRGVAVFSAKVYTFDASSAVVTLSETEMTYDESIAVYKPEVTVKIGDKTLENDSDYYVEYLDNKAIGTATVKVHFINNYAGNSLVSKTFEIKQLVVDDEDKDKDDKRTGCNGCSGAIGLGAPLLTALIGGAYLVIKRKK